MFTTIVWATDGSRSADGALRYAKRLARDRKGRLVAVHAAEHFSGRSAPYPVLADEVEIDAKIRAQVERARAEGIDATFMVVHGSSRGAAGMIADAARETGADVIVTGPRHGLIAELLGEGVTQRLLHIAGCPVLVVPPERSEDREKPERELPVGVGA